MPKQPVTGPELRAIKRYLATRDDNLPWLFLSERQTQLTRQAVNYIVRLAGEKAKLGRVWPHMLHHSCGYYAKLCRTTLATAIPSTRHTTDVLLGVGSRGCGSSGTQRPDPTSWRVCSRAF